MCGGNPALAGAEWPQSIRRHRMAALIMSISIGTVLAVMVILNLVGMTIAAYYIMRRK